MHTHLLISLNMKENLKIISDMAFDSMDADGSGGLDTDEIKEIMDQVADGLGIAGPTTEDLEALLAELDDDFDGNVSKDEFFGLIELILRQTLKCEEDILELNNTQ